MTSFEIYTVETAPEKSREILGKIQSKYGFIPNVFGEMAESPALLKSYWEASEVQSWGNLSPSEIFIIEMTSCTLNNAPYCIAELVTLGEKHGIARETIEQLRHEQPLKNQKLEALRQFTSVVMKKLGRAEKRDLDAFFDAGYKNVHVMEVIQHLSRQFMKNYVSLIVSTPLDQTFEQNKVEDKKGSDKRTSHAA